MKNMIIDEITAAAIKNIAAVLICSSYFIISVPAFKKIIAHPLHAPAESTSRSNGSLIHFWYGIVLGEIWFKTGFSTLPMNLMIL